MNYKVLIIIPARGGSKGIPRKNIRSLNGNPLISYSIRTALKSKYDPDVYVTSDDDEILHIASKIGAKIIKRNTSFARDETTLDPVIYHAYTEAESIECKKYDVVVSMQPTSPLLKVESLDSAINILMHNTKVDTIISATNDTHLSWNLVNNKYLPAYKARVNRQLLEPKFKETGGFLITRSSFVTKGGRIGNNVDLILLESGEKIDIDTYEDWSLCEYHLKRKKILFVVSGNTEIGLGHVYNTLLLANDILDHDIEFLVDNESQLAYDKIVTQNYKVCMQRGEDILEDIKRIRPDVIINDRLDTEESYVKALKFLGLTVINFEDLGPGSKIADLVINAIYEYREAISNQYCGHKYFILRDEFLLEGPKEIVKITSHVLLAFGGVDPSNYTKRVLGVIYEYCMDRDISIVVVAGRGYQFMSTLKMFKNIVLLQDVKNISEYILKADIVFTSAGRTTYEVASLATPAIVLAQNKRETTHFFASREYGFINLGLGGEVKDGQILKSFKALSSDYELRRKISNIMIKIQLNSGRKRVVDLIKKVMESV
jgi:CMP-N-acetylneuraminic acid synthetase/spore coat polysaccharide biosynthesis predicted glycosyltransferase SpsG